MSEHTSREPMLDMFIFETNQLIEQLEQCILNSEKSNDLTSSIDEIFRIMHTIKGSAAMMLFNNISSLAHAVEDVFYYLREKKPSFVDYSTLIDLVLEVIDFTKNEVEKIDQGEAANENAENLIEMIKRFLTTLREQNNPDSEGEDVESSDTKNIHSHQKYYVPSYQAQGIQNKNKFNAILYFEEGCEMENVRAFTVVHHLKEIAENIQTIPEDLINDEKSVEIIRQEGFKLLFYSNSSLDEIQIHLSQTIFLKEFHVEIIQEQQTPQDHRKPEIVLEDREQQSPPSVEGKSKDVSSSTAKHNLISVNVTKLDQLMDIVGELVISEAMVTQNPELQGLDLEGFYKAARHLRKITNELQDIVMSIRMVPLSTTFQKMHRIIRDMSKKLHKEVKLTLIGEETEVDKNIIEHISDPLMHLIRNAVDHGIEEGEDRLKQGKPQIGEVILEAKNAGGEVWITVRDDGKGLDKYKLLKKAKENGLLHKPESDLTDQEIYSLIMSPGFSTKDSVTEFSGRGVGMDVVARNIESIGGNISIDSVLGKGTTISIKIPLTLAIVDGMILKVGNSTYTLPISSIKESFRPKEKDIIKDTEGNEMIIIRGHCYPITKLYDLYKVKTEITEIHNGIIIMIEDGRRGLCIFADALLGEQQVVIKGLPRYLKKVKGVTGCTLLGDGSISLILDASQLLDL